MIKELLHIGEKDAVGMDALTKLCGLSDSRVLRKYIADERDYTVILASPKGYFLPERDADGKLSDQGYMDTLRFYRKCRSMGISMFRSAKTARLALKEYEQNHSPEE